MDTSIMLCGLGVIFGSYINIFIVPILKDFCQLYPLFNRNENYNDWCEDG